jgi:hypothetical protein
MFNAIFPSHSIATEMGSTTVTQRPQVRASRAQIKADSMVKVTQNFVDLIKAINLKDEFKEEIKN